jgi:hypothetical protein
MALTVEEVTRQQNIIDTSDSKTAIGNMVRQCLVTYRAVALLNYYISASKYITKNKRDENEDSSKDGRFCQDCCIKLY